MKLVLLTLSLCAFVNISDAQESKITPQKSAKAISTDKGVNGKSISATSNSQKTNSVKVVAKGNVKEEKASVNHTAISPEERIQNINLHISAIDAKVEYISSDQNQKEDAESSGWFQRMAEIKAELIEERKLLEIQTNEK